MPVLRYALTNDLDDPVVILADALPMLDESLAGSLLFHDVSKSTARGNLSAVLGVLRADGSYDGKTGRAKIFSADAGRQFLNRLLRRSGCEVRGIRNRGGKRVSHPERPGWLDHTLGSVRTFVEQLYKAGVLEGQRALDVDGWHLRDAGQRDGFRRNAIRSAASAAAIVRDTGRYYRTQFIAWVPPRTSDTRWLSAMLKALRDALKDDCVILPVELAGCTAARIGEVLDSLLWDWWRASKFGNEIFLRNKGGGDARRKRQHVSDAVRALLVAYIDGARLRDARDGLDMTALFDLGRRADRGDRAAMRALKSARLFVNTRGGAMTYDNLRLHLKPVLLAAGIPATLHWIRHEYVFRRLREIDAMDIGVAAWKAEREALANYMGWRSGTAMFEVYDAFERDRSAHAGAAEYAQRLALDVTASQRAEAGDEECEAAPLVDDEESAAFKAFLSDDWCGAANDDDFQPLTMAS